jgi:hypothetical protein
MLSPQRHRDLDAAVAVPIGRGIEFGRKTAPGAMKSGFPVFVGVNFQHDHPLKAFDCIANRI